VLQNLPHSFVMWRLVNLGHLNNRLLATRKQMSDGHPNRSQQPFLQNWCTSCEKSLAALTDRVDSVRRKDTALMLMLPTDQKAGVIRKKHTNSAQTQCRFRLVDKRTRQAGCKRTHRARVDESSICHTCAGANIEPGLILFIFLPALLFESSMSLEIHQVRVSVAASCFCH
jgi:hypothetical protein